MQATTFTLGMPDGVALFVYRWLPDTPAQAVVQIAHGWAEHAGRYARVAEALCREGYTVDVWRRLHQHIASSDYVIPRGSALRCLRVADTALHLLSGGPPRRGQALAAGAHPPEAAHLPVGSNIRQLLEAYRAAGLEDVQHRFYRDGRHECLNESNRDEVTRDLIGRLNAVIARVATPSSAAPLMR